MLVAWIIRSMPLGQSIWNAWKSGVYFHLAVLIAHFQAVLIFYTVSKQFLEEITLQSMCLCRNLFLSTSISRIASILELAMWFSLMPMRKGAVLVLTISLEGIQIQNPKHAWLEYRSNLDVARILQQCLRNSNFRTWYIKKEMVSLG